MSYLQGLPESDEAAEVVSPYWHVFHTFMGQADGTGTVSQVCGVETGDMLNDPSWM